MASAASDAEFFRALRAREFSRLDESGQAYLDYTGSGLYGESQIRWHRDWLAARVLGNPHSDNPASLAATSEVERVTARVLDFFGADPDEYALVFTANATAALKLVGEAFPFEPGSRYVLATDNHNSVGGIREYARRAGATCTCLPLDAELRLDDPESHIGRAGSGPSLFAFPAQSNFSGVKHPPSLVTTARERGFRVLVDTAAFAPCTPLHVGRMRPDFACISFYKLFGYPTGLGALLARKEALAELRRPWYAGGTVDFVSIQNEVHQLRPDGGGFEDGTLDFLGIAALEPGLDLLEEIGMERLERRVQSLVGHLLEGLATLRHEDRPAVALYGPASNERRGGTVSFNLLDPQGHPIPYERVEAAARERGVSVRGGCFCNPGAAEVAFGMPAAETRACLERLRDGFSLARFRGCLGDGVAVGAVRASIGMATVREDLDRLLAVLRELTTSASMSTSARA
ncbi:MAG: aminotransferase class V-fold PLP-dependent enzyme [Gemmatimonadetes bacterium]|nr:aminotransferase class V-fold PLP-dependent enzyme [Gemmatimonadota bacterium]